MAEINVGIVRDGPHEGLIFGKIVECLLSEGLENKVNVNVISLKQSIHIVLQKVLSVILGNGIVAPVFAQSQLEQRLGNG
jgi:hypothetical protein